LDNLTTATTHGLKHGTIGKEQAERIAKQIQKIAHTLDGKSSPKETKQVAQLALQPAGNASTPPQAIHHSNKAILEKMIAEKQQKLQEECHTLWKSAVSYMNYNSKISFTMVITGKSLHTAIKSNYIRKDFSINFF
jgi:hypothetical protein